MSKKVVIVGGHGNTSMRLTKLLTPKHNVTSIIRSPSQQNDIKSLSATPLILSVSTSPVSAFTKAFEGADVVYFSCGGGWSEMKQVDYEGAVKVADAIEAVQGKKPLFILVSSIDARDPDVIPPHYNAQDVAFSKQVRNVLGYYLKWKYEADKNIAKRTAFKWIILRPGELTNGPGLGKATLGRTHMTASISRQDVAQALALLIDREDAAGLVIDMVGGSTPMQDSLNAYIKKGEPGLAEIGL
ncbi:NAD(P)-binding protein [Pholiota conissans]|uniref:NAD(P)-binding protein n=1 Tax=Pholiota conissans TaxID=109636 RepID=A0A9P5YST9_9AGAR|nr:NAD(P)-binding protein [Pholiota conissans]